jgi:hypothetical protein
MYHHASSKRSNLSGWIATVAVLLATGLSGQVRGETPRERTIRLVGNAWGLVAVSFDRELYFPGEEATVTVTTTNNTPNALEIPDPTDPQVQGFNGRGDLGDDPNPLPPDGARSTFIQPGQTISVTIHTADKTTHPWTSYGRMSLTPGRVRYHWWSGGFGEAEVGKAILDRGVLVPLHKFETATPPGRSGWRVGDVPAWSDRAGG